MNHASLSRRVGRNTSADDLSRELTPLNPLTGPRGGRALYHCDECRSVLGLVGDTVDGR